MVPNEWREGRVRDLIKSLNAGVSVNSEDDGNLNSSYKILKTSCVSKGVFDPNETKSVVEDVEISRLKEPVLCDSIIISRMNTPALVGANGYIENGIENTYLPDRLWQAKPKSNDVNMKWLGYWFASSHTRYTLSSTATGTSGSMKNITKSDVLNIKIDIPPLPEQRKIAKILSTWDKAISTTERLIDNSKQQKKALMQQLLTGKKRLLDDSGNPFEGEWEEIKLEDIVKYHKGYTYKSTEYSEESTLFGFLTLKSFLRGGGYSSKGIKYLLSPVDEKFSVVEGDLIFAITDLTRNAEVVGAPVLVPNLEFEKSYISMDIVRLEVDKCVDKTFLFYLLKIRQNRNFMRARASGSTVLHLDVKGSKKLKLRLPKLKREQCEIATVLINADKEIKLFEQQLADLKQEKKALMQQLLTGKRRVAV